MYAVFLLAVGLVFGYDAETATRTNRVNNGGRVVGTYSAPTQALDEDIGT